MQTIPHVGAWLMEPRRMALMVDAAKGRHVAGIDLDAVRAERRAQFKSLADELAGRRRSYAAVIPICGPIEPRLSFWSMLFGGCSHEEVHAQLDHYLADPACESILLNVDSPGGTVHCTPELADRIYNARAIKPITAIVNPFCASAAFWIASAASKLLCTPSGDIGGVGVVMMHQDVSKMMEQVGIESTFIFSGQYKVEANPFEPLSKETVSYLQSESDLIHEKFIAALARNRNVSPEIVRSSFGQGRILMADAALAVHMIDGIETFQALAGARPRAATGVDRDAKARRLRQRIAVERERTGRVA